MYRNLRLTHLDLCHLRKVKMPKWVEKQLMMLELGHEGEAEVERLLTENGSENWIYIPDYTFKNEKNYQADFIVVMGNIILCVEVKNYLGHFAYKNNTCYLRGKYWNENVIHKMTDRMSLLRKIGSKIHEKVKVFGVMIFINENCTIDIDGEFDFDIVTRNEVGDYFRGLSEQYGAANDWAEFVSGKLENYRIPTPFKPLDFEIENMRRGINCAECMSFDVRSTHKSIRCFDCGSCEKKSDTIMRMAEDLRLIHYHHPEMVTSRNVYEFTNEIIHPKTISRILSYNYSSIGLTNKLYYDVPVVSR